METLFRTVISLVIVVEVCASLLTDNWDYYIKKDTLFKETIGNFMENIYRERSFESILVIQQINLNEPRLDAVFNMVVPKVVVTTNCTFSYMQKFNTEILTVVVLSEHSQYDIIESAAQILNYMRQTRIWFIAMNAGPYMAKLKADLLQLCQKYKMTNVILTIAELSSELYQLKPYPYFQWLLRNSSTTNLLYYPQHWRNMSQKVILTYTDQTAPRAVLYKDKHGNLIFNGLVVRLIFLFAELFNATLKMCCPLELGIVTPYTGVNKMVDENRVDIPLTSDPVLGGIWLHRSYVYEIGKVYIMVPCSRPLNVREIYTVLLNRYFFGYIGLCTFLLTAVHSLGDFCLYNHVDLRDFIVDVKILPGILSQSSPVRKSPWRVFKIIYILLFLAGLNITVQFSAHMNTLFASPPHHPEMESLTDIKESTLKLLVDTSESKAFEDILRPVANSMVYTDNTTKYLEMRKSFNTTYGYVVNSALWNIFVRKQLYFSHNVFCITDNLLVFPFIHWVIRLQQNSEFKEPLDFLIHRVHEMGFMESWESSTFGDLLKMKVITLHNPNPESGAQALSADDLLWVWMILLIGFINSSIVFLLEILLQRQNRRCRCMFKICSIISIINFVRNINK